ncbi:Serine/Threonine kinase domain protein (macronuclear) [Tetrahymena thermophila SB210]|uniref:Serine/Threonine kinase domain protein n=1 Tax=Tetrahymena thermophila (strain SB210) TaxID=312017 RepID=I7LZE3_TETTS|nr:Serine/Threonine kinase domain protein [Tetrahymena thermophila SB210]EAR83724.2 Serine/Threonine kinase domain protein [Tetrahymena thermophila SB210]|eukprot:XP_001031387.2 Serine/Threonine kinase domain protein [Tetrahymena thermophila SB210]
MDNLAETFDELNLGCEKSLSKQFNEGEKIIMSCNIYKFNDYKRRQERNLLITTHAIYNLNGSTIKRKIDMSKIKALTVSTLGTEFVIHVPDEYDYRYASTDKWDRIIMSIVKAYNLRCGTKMPCYFKDDVSLFNYATTKHDKKKKMNRMPVEDAKLMDENSLKQMMDQQANVYIDIKKRTSTLWSREKGKEVKLDDFNVLKVLGAGAFGTVLLVEEKQKGEWFAMKVIKKDVILEKGQFEHTKTEKMILEHVNHPYLVNLVYAFQDPSRLFFVMQFMKGGELFQHLRIARRFEEKRAKFYAAQLSLGLGHLHSKNIVYRDLKLENILMDDFGNVYVSDFGMAKMIKQNELAMTFCGTPEYLSPEVILGHGCDQTTDWWSLGILTYEMMFGLPPFYNKQQATMFKLIKEAELKFPEKPVVSAEAKDFISKCLNRDRRLRLGAKNDLQEIMQHPWFKDIDWNALLNKQIEPPFKPNVSDERWLDNFDKDFTSMKPVLDEQGRNVSKNGNDPFDNF